MLSLIVLSTSSSSQLSAISAIIGLEPSSLEKLAVVDAPQDVGAQGRSCGACCARLSPRAENGPQRGELKRRARAAASGLSPDVPRLATGVPGGNRTSQSDTTLKPFQR